MLSKKKKIIIVSCFTVLLLGAGVLNLVLNKTLLADPSKNTVVTNANFFSNYRTDRTETRNQEILYLDAIISSNNTSAEAKKNAEQKRQELVGLMETELALEGLIKAKGFNDAVVSSSTSAINVIVKSAELSSDEVAQIVDIIETQTNYTIDNIKIIPVE